LNKATEGIFEPILTNNISKRISPGELHIFGDHWWLGVINGLFGMYKLVV